jgi:hypothetical protein
MTDLNLPYSISNRSDVGRLRRELDVMEAAMQRKTARKDEKPLPFSPLLNDLSDQNKLNLLKAEDRATLKAFLDEVHQKEPTLHFSFSTNPSPRFLANLIAWLRKEIDPFVLLQIGLEPALGAGCVVRTTNKYFDLSLRHYFEKQRDLLLTKLKEGMQ